MATQETQIVLNALNNVSGLSQKSDEYIQSIAVWVVQLSNIRVEKRASETGKSLGLMTVKYKGGYASCSSHEKEGINSWPFLWYMGPTRWSTLKTVNKERELLEPGKPPVEVLGGEAYPWANLVKSHNGDKVPYNFRFSILGNHLKALFPEEKDKVAAASHMGAAWHLTQKRLAEVGEIQLHLTVGLTPETYASGKVTKMYKSSSEQEDKWVYEVLLRDEDILGCSWVTPKEPMYVQGLSLGQVVNMNALRLEEEEQTKEVLLPEEVLPKDATVLRYCNKQFGKFLKEQGLEKDQASIEAFLGTFTEAFASWVAIPTNKKKAVEVLLNWNPVGKAGPRAGMGMGKPPASPVEPPAVVLEKQVVAPAAESVEPEPGVQDSKPVPKVSMLTPSPDEGVSGEWE